MLEVFSYNEALFLWSKLYIKSFWGFKNISSIFFFHWEGINIRKFHLGHRCAIQRSKKEITLWGITWIETIDSLHNSVAFRPTWLYSIFLFYLLSSEYLWEGKKVTQLFHRLKALEAKNHWNREWNLVRSKEKLSSLVVFIYHFFQLLHRFYFFQVSSLFFFLFIIFFISAA